MDRAKMAEFADRIKKLSKITDTAADDLAAQVRAGQLTADEAAERLDQTVAQAREDLGAPRGFDGARIGYLRLLIDQRLPEFAGLIPGRHL